MKNKILGHAGINAGTSGRLFATLDVARRAYEKHGETCRWGHYTGIVTLHGMARLGMGLKAQGKVEGEAVLADLRTCLRPFLAGEELFKCNFPNYQVGGNGAAYAWWQGALPEVDGGVFEAEAEALMKDAPRDRNGVFCHPREPGAEIIWIDVAFAVTPFLLFCGLKAGREDWVVEGWEQTRKMVEALRVEETGLVNQAINYRGAGHRTEDHWSRGNGWALLALAELVQYFPETHPERGAVVAMYRSLVEACLRVQDEESGLWRQEMTMKESYFETSGSGLILYALGAGLEAGLWEGERYREALVRGLRGLLSYVALDGSVHQTCVGCLSPGAGTKEEYSKHAHRMNDPHAFGPLGLAFGQAVRLGIDEVG